MGQIDLFDLPNNGVINTNVVVHNAISKSSHLIPVNFWMQEFKSQWQPIRRFTDDFKIPDYRINGLFISYKIIISHSLGVGQDFFCTGYDVAY